MVALFLASSSSPEALWTAAFEEVCERIGPCFARSETRERAKAYLRGLLSPVERKNGWQLAEEARETTPYAMQYLLNRAVWDSNEVRDQLQAYVRTLVDREVYLPKSWAQDQERCRAADVPEEVAFATKPELAARMLWRTLDAGLCAKWVTGDTVYGSHRPLRAGLEARKQAYALAVACSEQVEVQGERQRVDRIAAGFGADQWQRLSAGDGSKGPCDFDWARIELAKPEQEGWLRWLVVRSSLVSGEKPADLAYVLVFAPCAGYLGHPF